VVVVVRRIARALLAEFTRILPLFPDTCRQPPLEESESDVDMSNWQNFRRLDFVPVSGVIPFPRSVGSHRGVDVDASSPMSSIALGLRIHLQAGARERTHTTTS